MYDNSYPPPVRSAPALDYKVDMLEHSLQKEKDKSRRLDNDNASAQRELSDERSRRREAEEKANRMAIDNSNLVRQNDDLKLVLIELRNNYVTFSDDNWTQCDTIQHLLRHDLMIHILIHIIETDTEHKYIFLYATFIHSLQQ